MKKQKSFQKILITRFPYESVFSGEEIHTLLLAEKLRKRNFKISFLGSCKVLLTEFQNRGFKVNYFWGGVSLVSFRAFLIFLFTFPLVLLNFFFLALWIKFVRRIQIVYMLSLNEKLFLTPWLKLFGINVVWVEHSRIGNWLQKNPFFFLYRLWSRLSLIITVSKDSQQKLIQLGIPSQKIHFILNGIDLNLFKKVNTEAVKAFQAKYPFSKEGQKIGLITRLYPDKGLKYFFVAFKKLSLIYPNLQAFVVGEGPALSHYQKELQKLPIHFLGKISHNEIPLFLNSIDFFILPSSQHDPFGLAPAEAMAAGKPVVVTDVCGISDFMQNEQDGLILPAKDSKAIETALQKIILQPKLAQSLALNGQKLAEEKFSLERMVREYEEIFLG